MNEICGDNRFEIIAKAKEHLLDATNIDTSEDEMKVLDSFLFRCWQMGWLDRYAEQTEPNCSEKPNNCETEPQTEWEKSGSRAVLTARCLNCKNAKACKENNWEGCKYETYTEQTEPQTDCHWK